MWNHQILELGSESGSPRRATAAKLDGLARQGWEVVSMWVERPSGCDFNVQFVLLRRRAEESAER